MHPHPLRRVARLASGLVLFTYLATHLVDHALGIASIATAEAGLRVAVLVWHSVPATVLLYGAVMTHVALAFESLYGRETLRMPPVELVRMALGFTMPTILIGHAVSTRLAFAVYGHPVDYAHVVWQLQHSGRQGLQIALLVPGWFHGCLGLKLAFRRQAWFRRARIALHGAALVLPALAVLGFLSMTREVTRLAADPGWVAGLVTPIALQETAALNAIRDRSLLIYGAAIATVLAARCIRARIGRPIAINLPLAAVDRRSSKTGD